MPRSSKATAIVLFVACVSFQALPTHWAFMCGGPTYLPQSTVVQYQYGHGTTAVFSTDQEMETVNTTIDEDVVKVKAEAEAQNKAEAEALKRKVLQLGASFDRGFGASRSAGKEMETVIESLELYNKETEAARGISGDSSSPLTGKWRMVWTTAQDVLSLNISPLTVVGAIYQVFEPPVVTNIIDLIPRAQSLLPPSLVPQSLLRAEVTTRGFPSSADQNRVILSFESVKLKPVEFLGMDAGVLPPLGIDFPKMFGGAPGEDSPGYFDVTYLDEEMLIIKQNVAGGLFVLVNVEENNP